MVILRKYFGTSVTSIDEVRPTVWNIAAGTDDGSGHPADAIILEQYKLYCEMADRISARRGLTNTFFLSLNTAIFAAAGTAWAGGHSVQAGLLLFPLLALIVQCGAWFFLLRSYRQLNSAKYTVIGVLEERLPASPYWKAEWRALGEGRDRAKYWPMSHLEQWIPVLFAAIYLASFIALAVS